MIGSVMRIGRDRQEGVRIAEVALVLREFAARHGMVPELIPCQLRTRALIQLALLKPVSTTRPVEGRPRPYENLSEECPGADGGRGRD